MKKERIIKIAVLSAVFVIAIMVSSTLMNRGNADMTAEMGKATLPTISFSFGGQKVNLLVGHKTEMGITSVRDSVLVYDQNLEINMHIGHNKQSVKSLTYEILSLDGNELLYKKSIAKPDDTVRLEMNAELEENQEGLLKITLYCDDGPVYYYVRVSKDGEYYTKECLQYVLGLHDNLLYKKNEDDVKKVMEPNEQGDNTTLQHVNIHSNLEHVMWGDLEPKYVTTPRIEIKETKNAYTEILLQYQVSCNGDNNDREVYAVKEFFRVSKGTQRIYLLEYDRTMEEVFDSSNVVLSGKGVLLGIANKDVAYVANQKGTIVAFVTANELWHYNKEKDAFSLVFSFASAGREDERNTTAKHQIEILFLQENGDMAFCVRGYMNRGIHEGESGMALYYYDMSHSTIREEVFVSSTASKAVIEKEWSRIYYHSEKNIFYAVVGDRLIKTDINTQKTTIFIEGLEEKLYAMSGDGRRFVCQKETEKRLILEVWDFYTEKKWVISGEDGDDIIPIGFVGSDLVYGYTKEEHRGYDGAGKEIRPIYRLEIRDSAQQIVKTYSKEGLVILDVQLGNNMITLKQGKKSGSVYQVKEEDYITSNQKENTTISLQSYWTDLKETQYRLTFSSGIQDKNAKMLRPKHVLQETPFLLNTLTSPQKIYYTVYVCGNDVAAFEEAGEAINYASKNSGLVISAAHNYLWEENNKQAWYHNFGVSKFALKDGETSLMACVRKVLWYEGKNIDVLSEMQTKTAEQVLEEQIDGEVVSFEGCSVKNLCYLIDKGIPIIALKNNASAILLIGYDAGAVTYIDPASGGQYMSTFEKVDSMLAGSGNAFIAYIK